MSRRSCFGLCPCHGRRISTPPSGTKTCPRLFLIACRSQGIVVVKSSARKPSPHKTARRKPASRKPTRRVSKRRSTSRRWSARVTRESDALDLEQGVFTQRSPKAIAASLKRSAERSDRRKSDPYRSALSMLTFYINRAGKNLAPGRRKALQRAKTELRRQFGRE